MDEGGGGGRWIKEEEKGEENVGNEEKWGNEIDGNGESEGVKDEMADG